MGSDTKESAPREKAEKDDQPKPADDKKPKKRRRSRWRTLFIFVAVLGVILGAARLAMPSALLWYVNRTIDKNPLYDGKVGDIDVSLWRGAYTIKDIRLNKTTGNVPVPLFASKRVDLALQWDALFNGKVVGRIVMDEPELNFVDGKDSGEDQTGAGGPWLQMIDDLFPFKINSAVVNNGSIHFRAFASDPPLDASITDLNASVENLSNIHGDTTPLIATVKATGLAMGSGKLEYEMKLNPESYHPTFDMALRLIGLDVTKTNDLTRAYGAFDFEDGFFDLVVELKSTEGQVEGYVKPLFRHIKVLSLSKDIPEDNVIEFFWEALVGGVTKLLQNQPRDQFATLIPLKGDFTNPKINILEVIGNILRNAFIRAYMPRLQGVAKDVDGLHFAPGSITDPSAVGASP